MNDFLYLIPISLCLGVIALKAFFWSLRNDQYDDLDGAAERILFDDGDRPLHGSRSGVDSSENLSREPGAPPLRDDHGTIGSDQGETP